MQQAHVHVGGSMAKGIATLMDTIFLILLSMVAASILFYAAGSYGKTLIQHSQSLFVDYYVRQAVRTFVTVSDPPTCGGSSWDYALAEIKLAYFNNDPETIKNVLSNVGGKIMEPLAQSSDYLLALEVGNNVYYACSYFPADSTAPTQKKGETVKSQLQGWLSDLSLRTTLYTYSVPIYLKGSNGTVPGTLLLVVAPGGSFQMAGSCP